jgi:uncharacterized small protein (DUF1192 family)|tara:strand:+ start:561 stop:740 length:180 start_codon:yes stop_codon:yes gene_type:complete
MAKKKLVKKHVSVSAQTPKKMGFVEYVSRDQEIADRIAARNSHLEILKAQQEKKKKKKK